jgi:hypothetical protein
VKLGGLNTYMDVNREFPAAWETEVPTMIVGFDLTREVVQGRPSDSIIAAVGSMDARWVISHLITS